mmetsp:Transcript_37729/g.88188  ORF Transcript_37729/g.88188 Transcript_37729/m.88188 type:complete len:250 (-) Transcript_37729:304-1053(-)
MTGVPTAMSRSRWSRNSPEAMPGVATSTNMAPNSVSTRLRIASWAPSARCTTATPSLFKLAASASPTASSPCTTRHGSVHEVRWKLWSLLPPSPSPIGPLEDMPMPPKVAWERDMVVPTGEFDPMVSFNDAWLSPTRVVLLDAAVSAVLRGFFSCSGSSLRVACGAWSDDALGTGAGAGAGAGVGAGEGTGFGTGFDSSTILLSGLFSELAGRSRLGRSRGRHWLRTRRRATREMGLVMEASIRTPLNE